LEAFENLSGKISSIDDPDRYFDSLNIKALLVDPWWWGHSDIKQFLDGKTKIPKSYPNVNPASILPFPPGGAFEPAREKFFVGARDRRLVNRSVIPFLISQEPYVK
jgi:hypothetical protein